MKNIKATSADAWFSKCVREAAENTCVWCGKEHGLMDCSHIFSRRHRTIRWDPMNAKCLCKGCHKKWHENPVEAGLWARHYFGEGYLELLEEKRDEKVKVPHSMHKLIAKHYKEEYERLISLRNEGNIGPLDVISFDIHQKD